MERVHDTPQWGQQLQDNIARVLEQTDNDKGESDSLAKAAATAFGTSYKPGRDSTDPTTSLWDVSEPATVKEALDRLAFHISSGTGATPIAELP